MAKDVIKAGVKQAGGGKESIKEGSDFGAREAWAAAANPPSVKAMVSGKAKYKHDKM